MGLMEPLGSPGRKSPLEKRRREEREGNFQDKFLDRLKFFCRSHLRQREMEMNVCFIFNRCYKRPASNSANDAKPRSHSLFPACLPSPPSPARYKRLFAFSISYLKKNKNIKQ